MSGDDDDRKLGPPRTNPFDEISAREPRHVEIRQHDVECCLVFEDNAGFDSRRGLDDDHASALEPSTEDIPDHGFVVNNQDSNISGLAHDSTPPAFTNASRRAPDEADGTIVASMKSTLPRSLGRVITTRGASPLLGAV